MDRLPTDTRVIIVNYNLAAQIRAVLATGHLAQARVLVVDNCSQPREIEQLCDDFNADILLLDRNYGFAGAVNRGIAMTTEPYVWLLNPDVRLGRDTLPGLIGKLEAEELDAVSPILVNHDGTIQVGTAGGPCSVWSVAAYFLLVSRVVRSCHGVFFTRRQLIRGDVPRWICMACFLSRRSAFDAYGLVPEWELVYAEDVAWGLHATAEGAQLGLHRELVVTHTGGAAGGDGDAWRGALVRLVRREHGRLAGAAAGGVISVGLATRRGARKVLCPRLRTRQTRP